MAATSTTFRPITTQTVAISGASAAVTNAFGLYIKTVRLVSTTDCYVKFGTAPIATTSSIYLPANVVEYFTAGPGEKVAALQVTAGGTLNVTECSQ